MKRDLPDEEPRARRGLDPRGLRKRLDRPRRVVLRDFVVYEIKLLLDGVKGIGISILALAALVFDLAHPGESPGHRFYGVMRLGERLDRWLSLYGAAEAAEEDPEGLFGVSRAGSPTLLGRLEALVHHTVVGEDEDEKYEGPDGAASPFRGARGGSPPAAKSPLHPAGLFDKGLAVLDRAVDTLDPKPMEADDEAESEQSTLPEAAASPPRSGDESPAEPLEAGDRAPRGGDEATPPGAAGGAT